MKNISEQRLANYKKRIKKRYLGLDEKLLCTMKRSILMDFDYYIYVLCYKSTAVFKFRLYKQ